MIAARRAAAFLFAAAAFTAAPAAAQGPVCPKPAGNPTDSNKRVKCQKVSDGDNIDIQLNGYDITAEEQDHHGVVGSHSGNGNIDIRVTGGKIKVGKTPVYEQGVLISTGRARGIFGSAEGSGDIDIRIDGGEIETDGLYSRGVFAEMKGGGRVAIGADGARIETKDDYSQGVFGVARGAGDLDIDIRDSEILTGGVNAFAVEGLHTGEGALRIRIRGGRLETKSRSTQAVYARRSGTGLLRIETRDADIVTLDLGDGRSHGIVGRRFGGSGDIEIDVKGGSIATGGSQSVGVYGWHQGAGGIDIALADGASVATSGAGADGIHAAHVSGDGTMTVAVGAGASVRATGENASGVQFGRLNSDTTDNILDGTLERAADPDGDGFRRQTAAVHGTVRGGTGDAAGVYLAGGGRVYIGPQGTAGAASGVSVWARRKLDTEDAPALHVSLNPGGRTMAKVLDGGWILNDGGKTTIVMNGVKLHDGTAGATGLWAPNGARDVTIREKGEKVTDRDFSADDFIVSEHYAPRAAVYEALPGFLLRLDGGGVTAGALYGPGRMQASGSPAEVASSAGGASGAGGGKARAPGSPLWLRIGGGFGKYAARQADAKARYRFRRWEAEAGMDFPLAEGVTGYASARLASGSTRVAAPGGGGKASATGYGLAAGAEWTGADGWFAAGRLSAMRYSVDVESATRGRLKGGAGAWVFGYRAEAGRRFALRGAAHLTGRVWLDGARMALDGFSDAVASQVEAASAGRLSAGAGLGTETVRALSGGGGLALRGAFGAAFRLDEGTKTDVSGEALRSKGPGARLLLGLGAEWRPRKDDAGTALGFDAEASGAGSRDAAYSLNITLRTAF